MKKVLIANRGEIAVRIIRACRELNIATVAIYSTADKKALHVQLADEAICVGPADPQKSYLNIDNIVAAATTMAADAVHPGYGFLSENAEFAQRCEEQGLVFIGPSAKVIAQMGDKAAARELMQAAGVPVIPGGRQGFTNQKVGAKVAADIGYPVMLKAAAGGGGKGMRVVMAAKQFGHEFQLAQSEAEKSFANGEMYLEKFIAHPRHIEVQIMGDTYGNVLTLGERDCSLQQNHQKMVEEAPSDVLDAATRKQMLATSVTAAKAIHYVGAGTIEFLYAGPGQFYFMEMNTRVQVEHPITELITKEDIVAWQLKIASDQALPTVTPAINGHAVECRVNAQTPGVITGLHLPGGNGVRVDTALYQGYAVPPDYDAMIAKIIVYAADRTTAIAKMRAAIDETVISGIQTNLDFLTELLAAPDYLADNVNITFIDDFVAAH
ncbi:acetyl/propionyl/methylcrotonyl-CoA carboxylase subunit alpha [Loigolactobacillus coryniformis subsp. coryniformis]|uniref:Acetyl-CoA carboxylase biotin carboxylase subunit n=1 Tax=Loigolactobacillus coryniformis TaxID=1610 RepID=A0A5B8TBX1_9LACO|nr:acetyl-CoA carboxylase biotin carboxylase subunit [Loigolactobacillus coryniformis]MDT3390901.1 acetyl-CoA carboxylase biotin carboxylase subunit [Bacillota bacterium]MBW4803789.1 acetyl-CoA carboxylase biotin carboxylase subunit [Loigolactobacillus coryniformis subsp. torquens]MBW4806490.1 acetyl-CoA carboxylase biotin carboxylase subunit [Loigolactobacillus coryniformis subsp. torquens]MDN5953942.1 acetyl-CoA carboxylase biotin carboxylase subunit [Loigolactobacillus coryniformis]QEA52223